MNNIYICPYCNKLRKLYLFYGYLYASCEKCRYKVKLFDTNFKGGNYQMLKKLKEENKKLYIIKEVANITGVSPQTISRLCYKGAIPYFRVSSKIFFTEKHVELIKWFVEQVYRPKKIKLPFEVKIEKTRNKLLVCDFCGFKVEKSYYFEVDIYPQKVFCSRFCLKRYYLKQQENDGRL